LAARKIKTYFDHDSLYSVAFLNESSRVDTISPVPVYLQPFIEILPAVSISDLARAAYCIALSGGHWSLSCFWHFNGWVVVFHGFLFSSNKSATSHEYGCTVLRLGDNTSSQHIHLSELSTANS
jgi:hypothetical protein